MRISNSDYKENSPEKKVPDRPLSGTSAGHSLPGQPAKHSKIFIVLPTYNEKENIGRLVETLLSHEGDYEVVVVDDNSPDKTWKVVQILAETDKRIHLIRRMDDFGRGRSGVAGFRYALDHGADLIVEMDADFSHDPVYVPLLVKAASHYEVILGSRMVEGGSDLERSFIRKYLTLLSSAYARLLLGVSVKDCNSGFRCFRRYVLKSIGPESIKSRGPAIVQEVLFKSHRLGFSISEVPIVFRSRSKGDSNLSIVKLAATFFSVLNFGIVRIMGNR